MTGIWEERKSQRMRQFERVNVAYLDVHQADPDHVVIRRVGVLLHLLVVLLEGIQRLLPVVGSRDFKALLLELATTFASMSASSGQWRMNT